MSQSRQDRRSEEADEWRGLYSLAIWRRPKTGLRAMQLAKEPRCERHLQRGRVVAADTVKHAAEKAKTKGGKSVP